MRNTLSAVKSRKHRGHFVNDLQRASAAMNDAAGQHEDDLHVSRAGGILSSETRGRKLGDLQHDLAASDASVQPSNGHHIAVASGINSPPDDHVVGGDAAVGQIPDDPQSPVADGGTSLSDAVEPITRLHRKRRFAMKLQQKIDRSLESYVRREFTDWRFDMEEKERTKCNTEVKALITAGRKGEGDADLVALVAATDTARKPADDIRIDNENAMKTLARSLPVYNWVKGVRGAADLGLATIIAETGSLSNYPSPAHVWSRLGYAPYDGAAGSTWKREAWRERKLTKEEWIAHPFSGERYSLFFSLSDSLFRAQWKSAKKCGTARGQPTGAYGQVYADRYAHTSVTHPEWTPMHHHRDALRVMWKRFLKDLWRAWRA
jgi:hypothetical protein